MGKQLHWRKKGLYQLYTCCREGNKILGVKYIHIYIYIKLIVSSLSTLAISSTWMNCIVPYISSSHSRTTIGLLLMLHNQGGVVNTSGIMSYSQASEDLFHMTLLLCLYFPIPLIFLSSTISSWLFFLSLPIFSSLSILIPFSILIFLTPSNSEVHRPHSCYPSWH